MERLICFLCPKKEIFSSPLTANGDRELKLLISEITMLDPTYFKFDNDDAHHATRRMHTYCCSLCQDKVKLLTDTYNSFVQLQFKLHCLSTAITYQIMRRNRQIRTNLHNVETDDDDVDEDDILWNLQFHDWNLSRLESLAMAQNSHDSETLLEDGKQLLQLQASPVEFDMDTCNNTQRMVRNPSPDLMDNSDFSLSGDSSLRFNTTSFSDLITVPDIPGNLMSLSPVVVDGVAEGEVIDVVTTYKCGICMLENFTREGLEYHNLLHEEMNMKECMMCQEMLANQNSLQLHYKDTHEIYNGSEIKECPICTQTIVKKHQLLSHLYRHKKHLDENQLFQCKLCDRAFDFPEKILEHMKSHEIGEFRCTVADCKRSFRFAFQLDNHLELHSKASEPEILGCDFCTDTFSCEEDLNQHSSLIHPELSQSKVLSCEICKDSFLSSSVLLEHVRRDHRPKQFNCVNCEKSFKTRTELKRHFLIHSGTRYKRFQCEECHSSFKLKSSLNSHLRLHSQQ